MGTFLLLKHMGNILSGTRHRRSRAKTVSDKILSFPMTKRTIIIAFPRKKVKGNTAQWGQRASADLLTQSCSMKNGKYTKYSHIFHTFAWVKISRRISLPHYAVLPKKNEDGLPAVLCDWWITGCRCELRWQRYGRRQRSQRWRCRPGGCRRGCRR